MQPGSDRRRFQILRLLGKGGFGDVHLALLRAPGGFEKQVALKMLSDENPPTEVLQRFRDEARVLGLIRDRAVVSVDPPVRLGGRWAVVMEYVDGASLAKLLRQHKTLPPTVALEIVQEVCRVLDKMWHTEGSDGRPMHLMHRDLKPANIQITRAGEVKVLDFGLAKGDFKAREAQTTSHLSGTPGYIAPERFLGQDGDRSDVFSLGVVLWKCLVGRAPDVATLHGVRRGSTPENPTLELAGRMLEHDPDDRPTPRQVDEALRGLRREVAGPSLSEWARENVPAEVLHDGPLDGQVLLEEATAQSQERSSGTVMAITSGAMLGGAVLGASALSVVAGLAALAVLASAGAWWMLTAEESTAGTTPPRLATVVPLETLPTAARGATLAADGRATAYSLKGDVWWSADRGEDTPVNLTTSIDSRCYEARVSPDGRSVMFGSDMHVYVAASDGTDVRFLSDGIPGGWLPGGERVSILRLQGVTSTGDTAAAELLVLDVNTGEVKAEHGAVRAEPRHGDGLIATKRKRSQELVLIRDDGGEVSTGVDMYPIGFLDDAVVGAPMLRTTTSLQVLPVDASGTPTGEPYELARLPHAYGSDSHIAPGGASFIVSTREAIRTFQAVGPGDAPFAQPLSVPSDVEGVWPLPGTDRYLYERAIDGATSTGVQWSVAHIVDGRRQETTLPPVPEVHETWLAGRDAEGAWFLLERSSGFELVRLSVAGAGQVQPVASLPSTTLLAAVSPDGEHVAITHDDLEVHIAPTQTPGSWAGPPLARGEATGWSPDGRVVVWDASTETASLVDPSTGEAVPLPLPAKTWAWRPDGSAVVVVDDRLHRVDASGAVTPLGGVQPHTELLESSVDGRVVLLSVETRGHHHLVTVGPDPTE